jgi:hypothetical protein
VKPKSAKRKRCHPYNILILQVESWLLTHAYSAWHNELIHQSQKVQRRFLDAQHGKVYSQLIRCALDDGIYGSAKIAVTGSMYADAVAATEVLNEFGDNPERPKNNARDRRFVQYLVDNIDSGINWCDTQRFFAEEYGLTRQAIQNAVEARAKRTISRMKTELCALDDNLAIAA